MKFGSFPVEEALGLVLAHTVRTTPVLKKGRVITAADIELLTASGVVAVVGARLDAGDVGEDMAAARIARRLAGSGLQLSAAHTGRCNLTAAADGLMLADKPAIDAANGIDEAIAIATLAHLVPVRAGQIVATVKIIPFAVEASVVEKVEEVLAAGAVRVAPFRTRRVAIISTTLPGLKPSVISSTERILRSRVAAVNGEVVRATRADHEPEALSREVRAAMTAGAELILIIGASATADREDTAPASIVMAGGRIEHFGMPVDPGNLLVFAQVEKVPVLVLPGCARSPKLNGADWVLQRLAADVAVARSDIMAMGVGGLLVDTPSRPLPRAQAVNEAVAPGKEKIAAIVLAAGQSRRMEGRNKLLMDVGGVPLVRRTVAAVRSAPVREVIVVTGHEAEDVARALHGLDIRLVHNPRYAEGLSTSLRCGLDAVSSEAAGAVICLGDMPRVETAHIARLIEDFSPEEAREIGVPTHRGKRGNPVLWGRRLFHEMRDVSGDVGARHLIGANESLVYEVEFEDTGPLMDLDTPDQWEDFKALSPPPRSR